MSFNGTGVYTLPGAQLVNGEVVSATENNTFRNDVATALNTTWTRDGQAPATANIPMNNHKFTGLAAGSTNGDSVRYEQVTSDVDITGGTIDGVDIGATTPGSGDFTDITATGTIDSAGAITSGGLIESQADGFKFPDGSIQTKASPSTEKTWNVFTSTGTYTVPEGLIKIRAYAFGAGGTGGGKPMTANYSGAGGGGGGCSFGDIPVTQGQTVDITISSGVATVSIDGTTYLTANKGGDASTITAGSGGTATKHASVTNGGAYTGGSGGAGIVGDNSSNYYPTGAGGGSAASPLGNGFSGGNAALSYTTDYAAGGGGGGVGGNGANGGSQGGGGGGAGGAAYEWQGGGAGGAATQYGPGIGRSFANLFSDPLMRQCTSVGGGLINVADDFALPVSTGGGGASYLATGLINISNGGDFGGGGGAAYGGGPIAGGKGGLAGGGGGGRVGGSGGYGGGSGGSNPDQNPTSGGGAIVLIYA